MKKGLVLKVLAIVMCFGLMALVGCTASLGPSQATDAMLKAVKAKDADTLSKYYSGSAAELGSTVETVTGEESEDGLTEDQKAVFTQFADYLLDFDYELAEEQIDGDSASVVVNFSAHDSGAILTDAVTATLQGAFAGALTGQSASQESANQFLVDSLKSGMEGGAEKSKKAQATLTLTKSDGQWKVDELNDDQKDAMFGGIFGVANQMKSGFTDAAPQDR